MADLQSIIAAATAPYHEARYYLSDLVFETKVAADLLGSDTPTRQTTSEGLREVARLLELLRESLAWHADQAARQAVEDAWHRERGDSWAPPLEEP